MVNLFGPGAFGSARPASTRPTFNPGNAPGDQDDWFKDCSSPTDRDGTEWRSAWLNAITANLRALVRKSGRPATNVDDDLLLRAVRSQGANYVALAGGTANALTAVLDPAPLNSNDTIGLPLRIKIASDNTGPATLDVGIGPLPIRTVLNLPLQDRDLPKDAIMSFVGTGTSWQLTGFVQSDLKIKLRGNLTVYVRSDGNDANNGLTNTAGGAFATIQGAFSYVKRNYDANGFTLTIQIGIAGSYVGVDFDSFGGPIILRGDPANQDSYVITPYTAPSGITYWLRCVTYGVTLTGVKLSRASATAGNDLGLYVNFGGNINLSNVTLELTTGGGGNYHCFVTNGGQLFLVGPIKIIGPCSAPFLANRFGIVASSGPVAVTIVGTPAYTVGFVNVALGLAEMGSMTFTGTFTGPRYAVSENGVIKVGGGATFFPGSLAGAVATGGQYV